MRAQEGTRQRISCKLLRSTAHNEHKYDTKKRIAFIVTPSGKFEPTNTARNRGYEATLVKRQSARLRRLSVFQQARKSHRLAVSSQTVAIARDNMGVQTPRRQVHTHHK